MVRQRGRSPRGERLIGYAPGGRRKAITFVAALRLTLTMARASLAGGTCPSLHIGLHPRSLAFPSSFGAPAPSARTTTRSHLTWKRHLKMTAQAVPSFEPRTSLARWVKVQRAASSDHLVALSRTIHSAFRGLSGRLSVKKLEALKDSF
jgi:hypothetical protein